MRCLRRVHRAPGLTVLTALTLVIGAACSSCGDGADERVRMLPVVTSAAGVPTGDPAGPAGRGAELIASPYAGDPVALREGEQLYREMNCADCHRYTGAGGMGPSLVDGEWLFGDTPADRFTTVHGGRARGMPAYGDLLPDESIWKVVAYIEELHRRGGEPGRAAGKAASATRQAQQPMGGRR